MTFESLWEKIGIDSNENWGDKSKLNGFVVELMDYFNCEIGEVSIHCAYKTKGHSKNSQHYKGNAVDFHFKHVNYIWALDKIQEFLKAHQLENFVGLGLYPQWNNAGFHIDVRGTKARWGMINGNYVGFEYAEKKARKIHPAISG